MPGAGIGIRLGDGPRPQTLAPVLREEIPLALLRCGDEYDGGGRPPHGAPQTVGECSQLLFPGHLLAPAASRDSPGDRCLHRVRATGRPGPPENGSALRTQIVAGLAFVLVDRDLPGEVDSAFSEFRETWTVREIHGAPLCERKLGPAGGRQRPCVQQALSRRRERGGGKGREAGGGARTRPGRRGSGLWHHHEVNRARQLPPSEGKAQGIDPLIPGQNSVAGDAGRCERERLRCACTCHHRRD